MTRGRLTASLAALVWVVTIAACVSHTPEEGPPVSPAGGGAGSSSSGGSGGSGGSSGGGDSTTSGSGGSGAAAGPVTPLPPRTFVFKRELFRGMDGTSRVVARHLYAFDLELKSERLISTFDDPGQGWGKN